MILVMGATGHVGSKVATELLSQGHEVRVLARHFSEPEKFAGADIIVGDANSVDTMMHALRECSAAFVMIPPDYKALEQRFSANKVGEVIAEAIEESGIKHIVNLSSAGADLESGTGPVLALHDQEQRLNNISGLNIVHLRPAYYMENLTAEIPTIMAMDKIFGIIPEDAPVDLVATKDVAARAAFLLANPTFRSHNVEYVLGERTLSYREIARVLGQTIGKPTLEYAEVPDTELRNYLVGSGMSESMADAMIELDHAAGNGLLASSYARDKNNSTVTSIEKFARTTFLDAYNQALTAQNARRSSSSSFEAHP
ncbi:NmrA family NAD(P)-binding protein [Bdellovibrio sp. SKB1291214]|uniref:NmrA family NAD(P)-binding protein n=1 Tax=Bdellovibrio sp. SKB1291214 TaxID=1732569 RepID=UPI000B51AB3B|nr:NmrA family NAD(P)-binding protein [Bdellovibrio sp. SKB1291214]UYL08787.1 NmrA family NAD(P)-binding protein [Bdellovibrio sp. SKB1291214]